MTNSESGDEYKDLSDNMRHYANMRFAQLTLYFALTAGLVTVVFAVHPPLDNVLRLWLNIVGAVGAASFGVIEERAADYWHHFRRRAVELEKQLCYKQYTDRSVAKWFTATNAARVLVWGGLLLWILAALCASKGA